MSWLERLFGKRGSSSEAPVIDPLTGLTVHDLRSTEEKDREQRARKPLSEEDEQFANKLVMLIRQADSQYSSDRDAYERTAAEIKEIGEHLCANGGRDRMALVAYRVQALGARVRDCELYWDGVCGWMY